MSTIVFVGILLLILTSCTNVQKNPEIPTPPAPIKEVQGAKPSEVLASLLAEQSDNTDRAKKPNAPSPVAKIAQNTPAQKPIVLAKNAPTQSVADPKPKILAKTLQKSPEKKRLKDPSATTQTIELIETAQDASPETLNELMQTMPKGKMVFAKPQTPAAPMEQPLPLPVATTAVPVDQKTADPIDNMAAEIMHAAPPMQQPETIPTPVVTAAIAAPKTPKSRGIFIPIHKGSQINLKAAAIDTLVASNSHAVFSDTAPTDNGSLLSRVKNRAFNHGVILEDKPVRVRAKQISEF